MKRIIDWLSFELDLFDLGLTQEEVDTDLGFRRPSYALNRVYEDRRDAARRPAGEMPRSARFNAAHGAR